MERYYVEDGSEIGESEADVLEWLAHHVTYSGAIWRSNCDGSNDVDISERVNPQPDNDDAIAALQAGYRDMNRRLLKLELMLSARE